ncbi:hypothetical protein NTE_01554 [Candidatus Nitrososphaera evergladensis SR1]|uniref:Uncharacterized protein n=1 Tax=Candidatus Nitrososphaera evergladensis SR1 TaxID=1459636 RepID=A0A075MS29_9ARCH|nr:hypothetical protein [Candidatus Nitrososphaera evergladensis]AIF83617.1 hypothetical protein NTE_01554 [Candidatus Nitrososphaera evergladensis SR1]
MKRRKIKPDRKVRPRNEITGQEVETFLSAIRGFENGHYPKLRDLRTLIPSMDLYKINVILRYLERSKAIIVDNDGYIVWTRKDAPDQLTLGDVADISDDLKKFLEEKKQEEGEAEEEEEGQS